MKFPDKRAVGNLLLIALLIFTFSPVTNAEKITVSAVVSDVYIVADSNVREIGYTVNGVQAQSESVTQLPIIPGGEVLISLPSLEEGKALQTFIDGNAAQELTRQTVKIHTITSSKLVIYLSLGNSPVLPPSPNLPPDDSPNEEIETPENPDYPPTDVPGADKPSEDNPSETPDTPGSDEPGSDEPYLPILPPADSVYNLAGFIPLGAGFLLLFLAFFWRRKVYRILKSHAKKHGEKPEKEHLKEIADAIINLVRDEGKYPEWKKNSDVMRRLGVDICELLDEMNYPKIVPREALVTEILKAAKGRLNRHRL